LHRPQGGDVQQHHNAGDYGDAVERGGSVKQGGVPQKKNRRPYMR
jgi:hypothetical protein